MESLLLDFRYALRRLAAAPGFSLGAVASLALGIGACTVIFSAVNGVLLRPLPYPEPRELVALPRDGDTESDVSIPDVADWRARTTAFAAISALAPGWSFDLVGAGEPERLRGVVTDPEYFQVLGLPPLLGRVFTPEENRAGGAHVALISEGLWRRRFAGDSAIVGRAITLSDNPTTIIGVAPAAFDVFGTGADLYLPIAVETPWALTERGSNHLEAIGRLAGGVALSRASDELRAVTRSLAEDFPRTNRSKVIVARGLQDFLVGDVRTPLFILLGAIGMVLVITCVNLTNFLLARAATRGPELAVRLALGAGRGRLVRQLLVESLIVALAGGLGGVLLAVWGRDLVIGLGPAALPRLEAVRLDWRVLAFASGLTLAAGFLVGLAPALTASSGAPIDALGAAGRSSMTGRRFDVLATLQVALALVLVIGAGLLLRSFQRLQNVAIGFEPAGVLSADIVLPPSRYAARSDQSRAFSGMVDQARAIPNVLDAAYVIGPPLNAARIGHTVLMADRPHGSAEDGLGARVRPVIGDYFRVLGIPVVQGRALLPTDDERAAPVAVVNAQFAAEVWPGRSPLGERIAFRIGGDSLVWRTVVGVVGDVRSVSLAQGDTRAVYTPYLQRNVDWQTFGSLVIRTRGDPLASVRALREAVWRVDPRLPLANVAAMDQALAQSAARERFSASALSAFALGALLIAVQGIYAVLAYAVVVRRREIGIRMALGAERRRVVGMVLRRGLRAASLGVALGLAGALALSRILRTVLFDIAPTDLATYAGAAVLLSLVAALASWLPARAAARVDPMTALRAE